MAGFLVNRITTFYVTKLSINYNMSRSRTIGTIFASVALGALTFFLTAPKKVVKKKDQQTSQDDSNSDKEDLFI